jgi:hypothetical protein
MSDFSSPWANRPLERPCKPVQAHRARWSVSNVVRLNTQYARLLQGRGIQLKLRPVSLPSIQLAPVGHTGAANRFWICCGRQKRRKPKAVSTNANDRIQVRNLPMAAVDIVIVWGTILWAAVAIWKHHPWIAVAQIPYFVWVSIATVLQISITAMNWGR